MTSRQTKTEENETGLEDCRTKNMTPFQQFIAHQDFGIFILLATKVKIIRNNLISGTVPNKSDVLTVAHIESRKGENEVKDTAKFIQTKLLFGSKYASINIPNIIIPKGKFKLTDDLMKESIVSLVREFNRCMTWYNAFIDKSLPMSPPRKRSRLSNDRKKKNGDAIAVKYSKYQTDILTNWMIEHRSHPFPNAAEIAELSVAAGLTTSQVVNWTTNVRKRNLKATVEKGKKPHHFLDFLFLANDRDKKAAQNSEVNKAPHQKSDTKRKHTTMAMRKKSTVARNPRKKSIMTHESPYNDPVNAQLSSATRYPTSLNPITPVTLMLQHAQQSNINRSFQATMKSCFVPQFQPGAYNSIRQITPPYFGQELNTPVYSTDVELDITPISLHENHIDEIAMDIDTRKDNENELLRKITDEGLLSTPPRDEYDDDTIWDVAFASDVSMIDVFKEANTSESLSCAVSMDEKDDSTTTDISVTEAEMMSLLINDGDDFDMLKLEI